MSYNNIFDVHAHYDDEKFDEDRESFLSFLPRMGVKAVVNASVDIATAKKAIEFSEKYPFMYATLDGELTDPDGRRGILEIKTATPHVWREWDGRIPQGYGQQRQVQQPQPQPQSFALTLLPQPLLQPQSPQKRRMRMMKRNQLLLHPQPMM